MTAVEERHEIDPLVTARAAGELAKRRRLAAVVTAAEAGRGQRQIAEVLGVSQSAVSQMLDRARRWPGEWERTPRQVALEYATGELTREQIRKEFVEWPWTFGHPDGPDGSDGAWAEMWVRGSWDDLLGAVSESLIDDEDYAYVFDHTCEH